MQKELNKILRKTLFLALMGFGWGAWIFAFVLFHPLAAQDTLQLDRNFHTSLDIPSYLSFAESKAAADSGQSYAISSLDFKPIQGVPNAFQTKQVYWLKLSIRNLRPQAQTFFLDLGNWSYIESFIQLDSDSLLKTQQTGHLLSLKERSYPKNRLLQEFKLSARQSQTFYFKVRQDISFYLPSVFSAEILLPSQVQNQEAQRLFYQGIFLGIMGIMALYNLAIYFSVRDVSFIYYVCSILGLGLYFLFYYGFGLELIWPNYPIWNAYSFALIVPMTRISWILFTRSYLNLNSLLPAWNWVLNLLIFLYSIPIIGGLISYAGGLDLSILTVNSIGTLGVLVLLMMLWLGYLVWRKGFAPARYFLLANIFFSIGSILFILRETSLLGDNFITLYSVQFGVVMQVSLFSLGLGNRLKRARDEVLLKEKEKQKLIEAQKRLLEREVSERTQDLQEKAMELEQIIEMLRVSENKLLKLNQLKNKFFSIISHDLKSPITTLNSFLNILINYKHSLSKGEFEQLALKTQTATERLSLLLDNLLQWSSTQMNQLHYQPEVLQAKVLIQESQEIFMVSAEKKGVSIHSDYPDTLRIFGDRHMLSFVFRNLLHNALKFTPSGGEITIQGRELSQEVEFEIIDTGIGMENNLLRQVQLKNHPVSHTGTDGEKGSGLGLLLIQEFLEKHGRELKVKSKPQEGTCFSFRLAKYSET